MNEQWHAELEELRGVVWDLSRRLTEAEQAREQQDAALALALERHPANGPREPARRRHLRLAPRLALRRRRPRAVRSGKRRTARGPFPGTAKGGALTAPEALGAARLVPALQLIQQQPQVDSADLNGPVLRDRRPHAVVGARWHEPNVRMLVLERQFPCHVVDG